jgi:hypothetical protein
MSVSFQGPKDHGKPFPVTLDLNNALASRLLRSMGYKVGEETAGAMPIKEAKKGISEARETLKDVEDLKHLWYLSEMVDDLIQAGEEQLTWF